MFENCHGALPLNHGKAAGERNAGTRYSVVRNNLSDKRTALRGFPTCECGAPLRFKSEDPLEGELWWCERCRAMPYIYPLGTHHEVELMKREAANRPPNEAKLRGIQ